LGKNVPSRHFLRPVAESKHLINIIKTVTLFQALRRAICCCGSTQ